MDAIGAFVALFFELLFGLISPMIVGVLHSAEFLYLVFTKGFSAACEETKQSWADERELRRQKQIEKKEQATTNSAANDQMMIMVGLVVIVGLVTGLTFRGLESMKRRRIESTRTQVQRIASRIAEDAKLGKPIPVQGDLAENDAWKQPIRLFVKEAFLGERYIVRSSGPDRKSGTVDDIRSHEIRIASPKEVAGELLVRGRQKVKKKLTDTLNRFKD